MDSGEATGAAVAPGGSRKENELEQQLEHAHAQVL